MPLNEVAHDQMFRGLKCAYTGKPITVRVVASGAGMPMYFSPDAFDPSEPVTDPVDLMKALSTRDGIMGVAEGEKALVCPYTGRTMRLARIAGMHHAVGGFSPSAPVYDRAELARGFLMRNGELPKNAPSLRPAPKIQAVKVEQKEPPTTKGNELRKASTDQAEALLAAVVPLPTTVRVPAKVPRKKSTVRKVVKI